MPNDEQWLRRSDEWVKATHESRLRKEKEVAEKKQLQQVKKEKEK